MKALCVLMAVLAIPALASAGVCKGEEPCKACKNCAACWYCSPKNPQQGSCGVVKAQADKAYMDGLKAKVVEAVKKIVAPKKDVDSPSKQ